MKKMLCALLAVAMVLTMVVAASAETESKGYKIAVVTGTMSQAIDERAAAMMLESKYGDMITTDVYPDNFVEEKETVIQKIVQYADDPAVKAIVVAQAVPGTAEAFRQVKERRDDIICLAGESQEDPSLISDAADVVLMNDFVARGYLIIKTAKELGCDTFVHISFPRHLGIESLARRLAVMKEAGKELGVTIVEETAADPMSDVQITGAQQQILEKAPEWIEKYGQNSAYFCTNDAHTAPLIKQLLEYGGYFIEADLPSPLMGYPGALGIDLTDANGDFEKILATVESAVCEQGGEGRFGTWAYSYGYTVSAGLAQHAYNVITGASELDEIEDISDAYAEFSPGANWNGSSYTNAETGVKSENIFLVYQDTYIMGNPGHYMGSTEVEVPEKYFTVK
jgi:DNA-binding LacI/PurR family transcriptional regulator